MRPPPPPPPPYPPPSRSPPPLLASARATTTVTCAAASAPPLSPYNTANGYSDHYADIPLARPVSIAHALPVSAYYHPPSSRHHQHRHQQQHDHNHYHHRHGVSSQLSPIRDQHMNRRVDLSPPHHPPPPPSTRTSSSPRRRPQRHRIHAQSHSRHQDDCGSCCCCCCPSTWPTLWFAMRLVMYHVGYCALSAVGGSVVLLGVALSLVLLPVCGFGVVMFHTLLRTVYYLSRMDAKLHNVVAGATTIQFPSSSLVVDERSSLLPIHRPPSPTSPPRQSDGRALLFAERVLQDVTPRSLLLILYFGSVRVLLALLILASGALLAFLTQAVATGGPDGPVYFTGDFNGSTTTTQLPLNGSYPVGLVGILATSVALHVLRRVSQAATRFVCCSSSRWDETPP